MTRDHVVVFQLDSVFNLQRPYDLVALLKQEDRAHMLENLKQELLAKKDQIDSSEDKNTGGCSKMRLFVFRSSINVSSYNTFKHSNDFLYITFVVIPHSSF